MALKLTRLRAMNALLPLLCIALVGCASSAIETGDKVTPAPIAPGALPPPVAALLPRLLADAAQRSGVAPERLRVVRATALTWPDGSLGCPQPGLAYTQALVPGWQVFIAVPSSALPLQYHGSDRGGWVHCPAGRASPAMPGPAIPRI